MAQILVRDLDRDTVSRLKAQARRHGRSLQGEIKVILIGAAPLSMGDARALAQQWTRRLRGRPFSDSARLIREDRAR